MTYSVHMSKYNSKCTNKNVVYKRDEKLLATPLWNQEDDEGKVRAKKKFAVCG